MGRPLWLLWSNVTTTKVPSTHRCIPSAASPCILVRTTSSGWCSVAAGQQQAVVQRKARCMAMVQAPHCGSATTPPHTWTHALIRVPEIEPDRAEASVCCFGAGDASLRWPAAIAAAPIRCSIKLLYCVLSIRALIDLARVTTQYPLLYSLPTHCILHAESKSMNVVSEGIDGEGGSKQQIHGAALPAPHARRATSAKHALLGSCQVWHLVSCV